MRRTPANEFVATPTAVRTFEKIRLVRDTSSVAHFTGPAGVGKTTIIQSFLREDRDARYVVFSSASRNLSSVLKDVASALNIRLDGRSTYEINREIEQWLSWGRRSSNSACGTKHKELYRGVYIIFDEIQNIDINATRQLLHFNDEYGLPIIMFGNEHRIKRTQATEAALDQVEDRIRLRDRIDRTREDIVAVCDFWGIEDVNARGWVLAYALGTTWRQSFNLLRTASELADDGPINVQNLQDALGFKEGKKAANDFLRRITHQG